MSPDKHTEAGRAVKKGFYAARAFRKLKEMRSMMKNFHSTQPEKKMCPVTESNRDQSDTKQNMYKDKSINHLTQRTERVQLNHGKLELMKRFLVDVDKAYNDSEVDFDLPNVRQEGDGETAYPLCPRTRGDGTSRDESFFSSFTERTTCIYLPTSAMYCETTRNKDDEAVDFNAAFLDDADSVLDNESDVSIDELEMNIIDDVNDSCTENRLDVVKKMFSKTDLTTWFADDDAMDSFMKTMIEQDDDDDEGVSSMSSDTDA